jgi:hypothetical protein
MAKRLTLKDKVQRLITEKHTAGDLTEAARYLEWVAKQSLRRELRPGTNVTFHKPGDRSKLPHGSEGTVVRVNQKTVSVDFGPRGEWRIPPALLKVGGKGAPAIKFSKGTL